MNRNVIKKILVRLAICFSFTLILSCSILNVEPTYSVVSIEPMVSDNFNGEVEIAKKDSVIVRCKLNYIKKDTGKKIHFPYKKTIPTLSLNYNGNYKGHAGCNIFYGKYNSDEKNISFKSATSTSASCWVIDIEKIVFHCLYSIDNYAIDGKQLFLKKGNEILMVYDIIYE